MRGRQRSPLGPINSRVLCILVWFLCCKYCSSSTNAQVTPAPAKVHQSSLATSTAKELSTAKLTNKEAASQKETLGGSESTIRLSHLESVKHNPMDPKSTDNSGGLTSIHRVWTATSSGSLDELSPEIISKLRQDVPFLAAYALRPRLVGSEAQSRVQSAQSLISKPIGQAGEEKQLASSSSGRLQRVAAPIKENNLGAPLGNKLGDFNEFNVDVSSISKSEHHHRRKTTLKRNKDAKTNKLDSFLNELKLAKKLKRDGKARSISSTGGQKAEGRNRKRAKTNNRRSRLSKKKNKSRRTRLGRVRSRPGSRLSRTKIRSGKQKISSDGTKGAPADGGDSAGVAPAEATKGGADNNNKSSNDMDENEETSSNDQDAGPEAEEPELKRAGDPDVEEGGDTVTVEPKFDGVEDNPELPEDEADDEADEAENGSGSPKKNDDPSTDGDANGVGGSGVAGGGIGATIGGGNGNGMDSGSKVEGNGDGAGSSRPRSNDNDDGSDDQDNEDSPGVSSGGSGKSNGNGNGNGGRKGGSSVEFANEGNSTPNNDDNNDVDSQIDSSRGLGSDSNRKSGGSGAIDTHDDEDDRRTQDRKSGDNSDNSVDIDYDDDNDYPRRKNGGNDADKKLANGGKAVGKTNKDCNDDNKHHHDDGHYDHSQDHQHEDNHHHHHDTIDWLRKSIPGEPGRDYPTLSRVNITDFRCSEQKWPGFYADVDADCQVFHICQADGRQDSFLCPNGTIFSQITRVCAWWNSFQCEDAPKYYELNSKLYNKQMTNKRPPSMLPMPMMRRGPSGSSGDAASDGADADDDYVYDQRDNNSNFDSSIDDLMRSMRRGAGSGSSASADDDVTQGAGKEEARFGEDRTTSKPQQGIGAMRRTKNKKSSNGEQEREEANDVDYNDDDKFSSNQQDKEDQAGSTPSTGNPARLKRRRRVKSIATERRRRRRASGRLGRSHIEKNL